MLSALNVVLLAGGGGGARMAEGLSKALPSGSLTVIANVADDEYFYGLHVSPDIDTLLYTLSGRVNRQQGWGIAGDQHRGLHMLNELGEPAWMKLGDSDFGMHIWRSWQLSQRKNLTEITRTACKALKIHTAVLPATNDPIATKILTDNGLSRFQEWFVENHCQPKILNIHYDGIDQAHPTEEVLQALRKANLIVIAPSNPWLSIAPIVRIPGIKAHLSKRKVPVMAISPLVNNQAVKGPLKKLMIDLKIPVSLESIANEYQSLIDILVIDHHDMAFKKMSCQQHPQIFITDIVMSTPQKSLQLAKKLVGYFDTLSVST